jgi:hypothetical protein
MVLFLFGPTGQRGRFRHKCERRRGGSGGAGGPTGHTECTTETIHYSNLGNGASGSPGQGGIQGTAGAAAPSDPGQFGYAQPGGDLMWMGNHGGRGGDGSAGAGGGGGAAGDNGNVYFWVGWACPYEEEPALPENRLTSLQIWRHLEACAIHLVEEPRQKRNGANFMPSHMD